MTTSAEVAFDTTTLSETHYASSVTSMAPASTTKTLMATATEFIVNSSQAVHLSSLSLTTAKTTTGHTTTTNTIASTMTMHDLSTATAKTPTHANAGRSSRSTGTEISSEETLSLKKI